jgi:hypothetical protein
MTGVDIVIEPWKKLVIHEILEYRFEDYVRDILANARAAGGGIASLKWANGIVFATSAFPDSESTLQEKIKGVLHYSSVVFAIKAKYERQIIRDAGTLNLMDVSTNEIFRDMAEILKKQSKFEDVVLT